MLNKFIFKSLIAEVGARLALINEPVQAEEVKVTLKEISKRESDLLLDSSQLRVGTLPVLFIPLVPVFHHLNELLLVILVVLSANHVVHF